MSTQSVSILALTKTAAAAITANRFITPTGGVPAAGANTGGVSRNAAASGDLFTADVLGTATVEASAAINDGAAIETTNDGRAVTQSTGVVCARALEAAGAAGDLIEVLLIAN